MPRVDGIGHLPFDQDAAHLFQLVSSCDKHASLVLIFDLPFPVEVMCSATRPSSP